MWPDKKYPRRRGSSTRAMSLLGDGDLDAGLCPKQRPAISCLVDHDTVDLGVVGHGGKREDNLAAGVCRGRKAPLDCFVLGAGGCEDVEVRQLRRAVRRHVEHTL